MLSGGWWSQTQVRFSSVIERLGCDWSTTGPTDMVLVGIHFVNADFNAKEFTETQTGPFLPTPASKAVGSALTCKAASNKNPIQEREINQCSSVP
jgi:hypothetical protein